MRQLAILLGLTVLLAVAPAAAQKVYMHQEAAITWCATGCDNVLTMTSLAAGAGQNGALDDQGTAARTDRYAWQCWVKFAAPVVGETLNIYIRRSDGAHPDNDDGVGDVALSSIDKLKNLKLIGRIVVDEAASATEFVASGTVTLSYQWFGFTVFNDAATSALSATAWDHECQLTPTPYEIQ